MCFNKKNLFALFIIFALAATLLISCKKTKPISQGLYLSFSTDTLSFDTVFTSVGSVTKRVLVRNNSDKVIKIDRIYLEQNTASFFRMNVDGEPTKDISNIDVPAFDSIYVFVALTVDPNNDTNPFVIYDKIKVQVSDKDYEVVLTAYGQNAHFIKQATIQNTTWLNDLPYVIIDYLYIDSANTLTIQKGCRIYMHENASIFVGGTLSIFGTKADSVIFQGDRLDRDYWGRDFPGEWGGIVFLGSSKNNYINYCIIKNGGAFDAINSLALGASIYLTPTSTSLFSPMLQMRYSKIENSFGYGIISFNSWMVAENNLIHSCGLQNVAIVEGGKYDFRFNTIFTNGTIVTNHINQPAVAILNYRDIDDVNYVSADLNANFDNNIIYGSNDAEIFLANKGASQYNLSLSHNIFKYNKSISSSIAQTNNIMSQNNDFVQFENPNEWDFHLKSNSPAKGAAKYFTGIPYDIEGNQRSSTSPSIGCYE